jgi:hypothetical protein
MNRPTDIPLPDTLGFILREYLKAMPRRSGCHGERRTASQATSALGRAEFRPLGTVEAASFGRLNPPRI